MNTIENLEIKPSSEHEREISITLSKEYVGKEYEKAIKKVQMVASRPGFRPGKLPKTMVMNFFGSQIKKELLDKLVENSFDKACAQKNVVPISKPKMEFPEQVESNKAFTYRAIFQIMPQINVPKHKGLAIETKIFVFDERDVEEEINSVRESLATFREATGRKSVQEKDLVQCQGLLKVEGAAEEMAQAEEYSIPLFANNVPIELRSALVGKKIGDTVLIPHKLPEDLTGEELSEQKREMMLTIQGIKERVLPDLDDDFAKDISEKFQTLDALKESVRDRLNITANRRNIFFLQNSITKALIDENPFEVPSILVERMSFSIINKELEAIPEKAAQDMVKNHWQELWDSVQEQSLFRVKAELIFTNLIQELDVKASDEEVDARCKKTENLSKEDAQYSVQVEKLITLIKKESTITEIKEPLFKRDNA